MRLSERDTLFPKSSASVKRTLVSLNRDLDKVKNCLDGNYHFGRFAHSISALDPLLSPVEATILYLEDRRFFDHRGIELRSIPRALKRILKGKKLGAISTIDQQVIRICTGRRERTVGRKLREILLAYALNFHCSKKSIFDYYIHYCYLGYRLEGVEVAAQQLFQKSARDLDWEQSAFIASLLPLPMPKQVHSFSDQFSNPRTQGIHYIKLAFEVSPRWAARVQYRYSEALKAQDFMAKSRSKR